MRDIIAKLELQLQQLRDGETFDCIHCGEAVPAEVKDHWAACTQHPAYQEVQRLRAALREIHDLALFANGGTARVVGNLAYRALQPKE